MYLLIFMEAITIFKLDTFEAYINLTFWFDLR